MILNGLSWVLVGVGGSDLIGYKGCFSGTDCEFCHLCDKNERKRRLNKHKNTTNTQTLQMQHIITHLQHIYNTSTHTTTNTHDINKSRAHKAPEAEAPASREAAAGRAAEAPTMMILNSNANDITSDKDSNHTTKDSHSNLGANNLHRPQRSQPLRSLPLRVTAAR